MAPFFLTLQSNPSANSVSLFYYHLGLSLHHFFCLFSLFLTLPPAVLLHAPAGVIILFIYLGVIILKLKSDCDSSLLKAIQMLLAHSVKARVLILALHDLAPLFSVLLHLPLLCFSHTVLLAIAET